MDSDQMTLDRLAGLSGSTVYDAAGEKIGRVEEIFYDRDTDQPEWIGIGTGFFGTKRLLVPVVGANTSGDGVTVPYDRDLVKSSPNVDGDEISDATEDGLYAHYGLQRSERRSDSGLPAGGTGGSDRSSAPTGVGQESVTRSEEELRVGTEEVEAGRVRLRKWVETVPAQATVELERETVQVHREALDPQAAAGEIREEEIEVTLHEERPVVAKETVARERISLDRDVAVETETVSEDVRRERVEIEGDADDTGRRPSY